MRNALLVLSILLLYFSSVGAQTRDVSGYYFSHIDGRNGLSHNHVKSVIQDSRGFMWFGTRKGLNRYDGTSVRLFNCHDKKANKGNQVISALYEDKEGNLWVGTDNGIYIYNPVQDTFTFFSVETADGRQITDQWIEDIVSDREGNVWVVAPNLGVFRYHADKKELTHYTLLENPDKSKDFPQCICIDTEGKVWIGTNGAGIFLYDKSKDAFQRFAAEELRHSFIFTLADDDGRLIVGDYEGSLKTFDKQTHKVGVMNTPGIHHKIIRYAVRYGREFWVGTQNGVYVVNKDTEEVTHIAGNTNDPYGLADNIVDKIYCDREGGIWVCTNFGGANYLPNRSIVFEKYLPSTRVGSITGKRISEMGEDSDGNIWIGTQDGGVNCFNPQTKMFKSYSSNPERQNVLSLYVDGQQVGAGYFKGGIDIVTKGVVQTHTSASLKLDEGSVYALCKDRKGNIWLGDGWSIFKSADNGNSFKRVPQFGYAYMQDILEDSNGNIWVATMGNGVFCFNPADGVIKHFGHKEDDTESISTNEVTGIMEDSRGNMWFSTDRGGIAKLNPRTGRFASYSTTDGLPDNVSYKPLEDDNGNIWFGTDKGLVCLNPGTKEVKVFTQNDGLPSAQFNYKSALKSRTGKLYFGTVEGLVAFNPYRAKSNMYVPPVFITGFRLFGEEVPIDEKGSPLKKSIMYTSEVTLPHNRSNLAFDFVSLSYTSPQANRYAYKMDGIDKEWTYTNHAHSVSYAKLPPGDYIFRVKGSNNDGLWNEKETVFTINILPPWWRTVWAYIIYSLLVAGLFIYSMQSYRRREVRRIREQQLLNELARERESHNMREALLTRMDYRAQTAQGVTMSKADEKMMGEMIEKVRENLSNPDFNVEALADELYMSRSSLHRKIKALTDLPPVDFIRVIRLKRAAELIQEGEYRINEICDMVGISSPSYFSKLFQKQFGMTPREFEKQQHAK